MPRDFPGSTDAYGSYYSAKSDDDLLRLAADIASLVPNAREALRMEMERRRLSVEGLDWSAQPNIAQPDLADSGGKFRRILRNFLIFLACDAVYFLLIVGVASIMPGVDFVSLSAGLTETFLRLSLLLAVLTAFPVLIPKRLVPREYKTLWIVGIVAPPGAALLLLVVVLLHLGSVLAVFYWPAVILWVAYDWWRSRKASTREVGD